ncbi:hypothetical protein ACHAXM_006902 [Skeletonema potamos]
MLAKSSAALTFVIVLTASFIPVISALTTNRSFFGTIKQPQLLTRPISPSNNFTGFPLLIQTIGLKLGRGKQLREEVVHKYFHGVDTEKKNASSRGGNHQVGKLVSSQFLGEERCREFLATHPDCKVKFHHGPTCGRGSNNNWVYAHIGMRREHLGIEPVGSPLTVQRQTRFLVGNDLKIREIVITRTFSRWGEALLEKKDSKM